MNVFVVIFNIKNMEKAVLPNAIGVKISDLSDEQLYKKCVECGMNAKIWVRKFAAMLPEVEKRGLHRKRGFTSIYEFAKKLAGMSDFTVDRILRLVKRISDKPILLRQFESGKQSWSKIETVSYIATKETEEDLSQKVAVLPQKALMAYVSQKRAEASSNVAVELKNQTVFGQDPLGGISDETQNENLNCVQSFDENHGGFEKMFGVGSDALIDHQDVGKEERYRVFLFHASIDVQFKLRLFKQRLEKERKQSFSWNEVFEILLRKLEERGRVEVDKNVEMERRVEVDKWSRERMRGEGVKKLNESMHEDNVRRGKPCFIKSMKNENVVVKNAPSRHIPAELKRQILAKYSYKCGFPKCNFPCLVLHHTKRFVLFRRHDFESIVPLCKKHHDLVHGGCIANEEDVPEKWVLKKIGEERKTMDEGKTMDYINGATVRAGNVANVSHKVANGVGESIVVDKYTGEVLDTKEKVDSVVMKYKMKNTR